jgi:hypothetical protein
MHILEVVQRHSRRQTSPQPAQLVRSLSSEAERVKELVDGVPHLQHLPTGFAPCLPVMVAKK